MIEIIKIVTLVWTFKIIITEAAIEKLDFNLNIIHDSIQFIYIFFFFNALTHFCILVKKKKIAIRKYCIVIKHF